MARSDDLLTLSRQDLYELVWSKPMTELAKDFGLSDVALAKRCRKLAVPVPGRGYWARVAAGQAPRQAPLRKRAEDVMDYTALTFDPPRPETSTERATEPTKSAFDENLKAMRLVSAGDLRSSSPSVKRTAVRLKRPWRKEIEWNRGERKGPVLSIDASEPVADRALTICELIIANAAKLGWPFRTAPQQEESHSHGRHPEDRSSSPDFGCLYVENEPLALRIDERSKRIDHALTDSESLRQRRGQYVYLPRWDYIPTGELRLHVLRVDSNYSIRSWKDGKRRRLEEQVESVLSGLFDAALHIKEDRERKRLAEIERRREEKLRWEQSERRSANARLVNQLEAQAGAWMRARFLRSYLRALRRAVGTQTLEAERNDRTINFLEWAEHYVDQLDPLCPTPHDPDLKSDRVGYYSNANENVHKALSRMLGQRWEDAFKIGQRTPPESERSASSYLFGNDDEAVPILAGQEASSED